MITYLRDLDLRSASSDIFLTWSVADSSNIRCTFNFLQTWPDSTSKPPPSSPLLRSSYMPQGPPTSRDHVNLNSFPPTSMTWCQIWVQAQIIFLDFSNWLTRDNDMVNIRQVREYIMTSVKIIQGWGGRTRKKIQYCS